MLLFLAYGPQMKDLDDSSGWVLDSWLNPYLHIWGPPCSTEQGAMVYLMNSAWIQEMFHVHVICVLPRDSPPVPAPSWNTVVTITSTNPELTRSFSWYCHSGFRERLTPCLLVWLSPGLSSPTFWLLSANPAQLQEGAECRRRCRGSGDRVWLSHGRSHILSRWCWCEARQGPLQIQTSISCSINGDIDISPLYIIQKWGY